MRFSSAASLLALAASTAAQGTSPKSDLDASVWQALSSVKETRSWEDLPRNRPAKRQSGWNPPSNLATPLKEVWDHCLKTYSDALGFKNYGWDQLIAGKGKLNMCVRWESDQPVTAAYREEIATTLQTQYNKWFKWLYGYDNFPYSDIKVNVVGWAVKDKSLLQGSTAGIDVYTDVDSEGVPQCSEKCGRFFHQDGNYNQCPGGADRHYDQSLWLTKGMAGGAGGDWGQRLGPEGVGHILLHEMGHTFALDDFYDWTPTGVTNFVMLAGSSTTITDFDGWMLRNWWYELSRKRGWQSGVSSGSSSGSSSPSAAASKPATTAAASKPTSTKAAASKPTTTQVSKPATTKASTPAAPTAQTGATAGAYAQCGGASYTGPTTCVSGFKCIKANEWYSQCVSA
ncbi:CBM1 domain-containing protein [Fusarium keratoplasticum]|uniref:CBM1 domain-containing protein n=1 Tax=Fusarium keratoplasticum TaxID=1328300 RepID=A0ACC0RGA7_9HYPO|nr:CBM1 domain-containing protein [Fusarium keratoplasticum]KAI8685176.1 CBM1 domain-containing protein [Fusarium keratoplasticum]KAI8689294.1 CBM1 domain-containing protein [Fusarium keratoplasticum]